MPAISVILPNYNHARFLKQRIDSILGQTFVDFELLIFDDASSDKSQEIINTYSDPRITQIEFSESNSGSPFSFWKKGIALAKSPLIWIAESDDYADPAFLDTTFSAFQNDDSLQIAFSASHWVNPEGEIIHSPDHETNSFKISYADALSNQFLKGPLVYNASSAVFKKAALNSLDFKKLKSFKYAGDWFFWSSFETKGNVTRLAQRLNYFRRHENNVSFQAEKEGLDLKEGLQIVGSLLRKNKTPFVQKHKVLAYWAMKVYRSSLPEKKKYLASLPSEVNLWYLVAPILSKIY
ncbi:Glycosyl transferase family 2 [Spirosomataceae bacterium TFI 002]|nr:Glycosyl transferase family 2 [Spirosomataceae bacterium TFI 002]